MEKDDIDAAIAAAAAADEESFPTIVHARPYLCIDRDPASSFVMIMICLFVTLVVYVTLSAFGVDDGRALLSAVLVLVLSLLALSAVICVRNNTGRGNNSWRGCLERRGLMDKNRRMEDTWELIQTQDDMVDKDDDDSTKIEEEEEEAEAPAGDL